MPPWSGDYHFNINVQECYAPADQGNRLAHLRPLFDMIWSWRAQLRENAGLFVGIEDGLMLPHGVDDRGMNMGGFWTGTMDHGCTVWVAKMMFDYWRFGGEKKFLKTVVFPFMVGPLRVYEVMLERTGDRFILPVSVSPEYRGAAFNAWGRNASFQLACIHWLLEIWQRVFTNAGHGTLHDYEFPGFTVMGAPVRRKSCSSMPAWRRPLPFSIRWCTCVVACIISLPACRRRVAAFVSKVSARKARSSSVRKDAALTCAAFRC